MPDYSRKREQKLDDLKRRRNQLIEKVEDLEERKALDPEHPTLKAWKRQIVDMGKRIQTMEERL